MYGCGPLYGCAQVECSEVLLDFLGVSVINMASLVKNLQPGFPSVSLPHLWGKVLLGQSGFD